jgi:hypothetical protein
VLAIIFVVSLPLAIIAHNSIRVVFSSSVLSEALSELFLLRGGVREQLVEDFFTSGWLEGYSREPDNPFEYLNTQDRLQISQTLFPDEWIRAQVQAGFKTLMEWIETDEQKLNLYLDFGPIKQRLLDGGSKSIVDTLVNSWPDCTRQQELILQRSLSSDTPLKLKFCQPSGDLSTQLVEHLDRVFLEYVRNIQSDTPFLGEIEDSNDINALADVKTQLLRLSLWLRWLRLIPLIVAGLIMALVIRTWVELSRWWGIGFMLGAMFGLLLVIGVQFAGLNALEQIILDPGVIQGNTNSYQVVVWSIIERVLVASAGHMIFIFILGAVLFGGMWAYARLQKKVRPQAVLQDSEAVSEMQEAQSHPASAQARETPSPPPVKPFDPDELSGERENDSARYPD